MLPQLPVIPIVITINRGLLDRAVHPLHLPVRPRMVGLGQPMIDAVPNAGPAKGVAPKRGRRPVSVFGQVRELNAVVGQDGVA